VDGERKRESDTEEDNKLKKEESEANLFQLET
jgi:hypothetical protein